MVDPAEFSIALKISPSTHKTENSTGRRRNEDLNMLSPETLFNYPGSSNNLEIKSLTSEQNSCPISAPKDLIYIKNGASLLR